MDKIRETKKNSFMTNVLMLLVAQIAVKLFGLIYRLFITNTPGFGDAGNGYCNAGYQIYTLLLALSSVGIPNAVSKKVSERQALGDYHGAHRIFKVSVALFAVIGAVCSLGLYFGAGYISDVVLKISGAKYTLQALAPSVLFVCLSSVIRGYFMGFNNAKAAASSQVIEQIFKCSLTILIVTAMIGQSPEFMAAGVNLATSIATLCGFAYIFIFYGYYRRGILKSVEQSTVTPSGESTWSLAKGILFLSVPIAFTSIVNAINRIIDMATTTRGIEAAFRNGIPGVLGVPSASQLSKEAVRLVGMLSKQDTLTNLPLALNIAFSTALVPNISGALAVGDKIEAKRKISFSLLISILIILPCVTGFVVLANPIYKLLYPNASLGFELLQITSFAMLFSALNQTVCGALHGMGRVKAPAIGLLCGSVVKFILNVTLIRQPSINIYGAAIGSVACQFIGFVYCFITLRRELDFDFNFAKYIAKPIGLNILMGLLAYASHRGFLILFGSNAIATVLAICVSALFYVVALLKFNILSPEEIKMIPFGEKIFKPFISKS